MATINYKNTKIHSSIVYDKGQTFKELADECGVSVGSVSGGMLSGDFNIYPTFTVTLESDSSIDSDNTEYLMDKVINNLRESGWETFSGSYSDNDGDAFRIWQDFYIERNVQLKKEFRAEFALACKQATE